MDLQLVSLEFGACLLGIVVLLVDLWTPAERKAQLGWLVAGGLVGVFCYSFTIFDQGTGTGATGYVKDSLAVYFQGYFVLSAVLVVLLTQS